jgi:NAD(P)-dependent dehydrogenase (short-subunit alcohol dehydrogenase family)
MENRFEGKVVLITGAGSGIGRMTAQQFAMGGAAVVVSDVNAEGGEETVALIRSEGGEGVFVPADVANPDQVARLIARAVDTFGRLDMAVNNAGIGGSWRRTADYPHDEWDRVLSINLSGVFYCMQQELRQMVSQGGGAIVNVASIAGVRGLPNASAYTASKHGVVGLTRTAALEYVRHNIRVNAVCPVFTRTPLFQDMLDADPRLEERLVRNIPMRRYAAPAEIAEAICWLCSDSAAFITGQAINVDGGMTA